jgi:replicative DNA helicase
LGSTLGLAVQPEVLQGLAGRPGFGGRGLLARFLYSLPASLVGRRQAGAPPVPPAIADRYTLELQALAASLTTPTRLDSDDGLALLTLDPGAGELLLAFERELEPRLAAGSGDLAHLVGWAAKLAGATCRIAGLLHLAAHLRDGWARPIAVDTFAGAARLAGYLIEHARAVFDLMGADPRVDDARCLLDWISRTGQAQFTRRDAHHAAPRGRFPKATDLDPALALLEEHGWLRRVDADSPGRKGGRPPSPRFLINPLHPATEPTQPTQPHPPTGSVRFCRFCRAWRHPREPPVSASPAVTLSNENRPSRSRPCQEPCLPASGAERAANAPRRPGPPNPVPQLEAGRPGWAR